MNAKPVVLIVDDEPAIISSITRALEEDCQCIGALNAEEGRKAFESRAITCVLSDQRMPGEAGSDFLAWVREKHPDTIRILITGYSEFESLVAAVNKGQIFHFLHKPWEPFELELIVKQAARVHGLALENRRLEEALRERNRALERENLELKSDSIKEHESFRKMVGLSEPILKLKQKVQTLLPSQSTVLITGESGTGKELVARALHFAGSRREKPFVAQNCAALPDSILESELFGHVKGAFTHAVDNRLGIIESAQGGTLFLDEVGDMSLSMQAKLLRFLQEGTLTQVGGRVERKVDVRVIAATHRDLESMVADKTFREDLFYRLNVIPLQTPPLRERSEDIPLLCEYFLQKHGAKLKRASARLSPAALDALRAYAFPGNVRELENAVEYALNIAGDKEELQPQDLPEKILRKNGSTNGSVHSSANGGHKIAGALPGAWMDGQPDMSLDQAVSALEAKWIENALESTRGNISQAAKMLGLSRQGLHNKLAKYGIRDSEAKNPE